MNATNYKCQVSRSGVPVGNHDTKNTAKKTKSLWNIPHASRSRKAYSGIASDKGAGIQGEFLQGKSPPEFWRETLSHAARWETYSTQWDNWLLGLGAFSI